jgi:hypothetical protein
MSAAGLAAALALAVAPQTIPPAPAPQEPTAIPDVEIEGRTLEQRVREFVHAVAAPPRRRGLARWRTRMCAGVVNLQPAHAQAMIDRIADVAARYEVPIGAPGCTPNVVIVFTEDGAAMANAMVEANGGHFRFNGLRSIDRGKPALDAFRTTDAPVRWWHVSLPVVGGTTQPGIRLPGGSAPMVPGEGLVNRGRPIADILTRVFIVVDVDQVQQASFAQLSDYVAMVALVQVDPGGQTEDQDTILNLFSAPDRSPGLSEWDHGYLAALYGAYPERLDPSDQVSAFARRMRRAERERRRTEGETQ